MSFKSILDKIGEDVKDVFTFLGTSKGQALVTAGENIVETIVPGTAGAITLFNNWLTEIIKTQALATAAAAQTGSDTQKAALVLTAIGPQAVQFATVNGLPAPTAAQINTINTLLVQALNVIGAAPTTSASTPPPPVVVASPQSIDGGTISSNITHTVNGQTVGN